MLQGNYLWSKCQKLCHDDNDKCREDKDLNAINAVLKRCLIARYQYLIKYEGLIT